MLEEVFPNRFALPASTPAVVPYPNLVHSTQVSKSSSSYSIHHRTYQLKVWISVREEQLPTEEEAKLRQSAIGTGERVCVEENTERV